jgi:predicted RNA binding protein YcfA (HicA-like mRNA interferase family)
MSKVPRNISGIELAKLLVKYGYEIQREKGSHLRLNSNYMGYSHKITIPDHEFLKIGTLNNILNNIADYLKVTKEQLIKELFTNYK